MTKRVCKFKLPIEDYADVPMYRGSEILHIGSQDDSGIQIWAIADTELENEVRSFKVRGTGHPFTGDEGKFLATVIIHGGSLVFHVFEAKRKALTIDGSFIGDYDDIR